MTTGQWSDRAASDVTLDLSRLTGEAAGADTRYTVALAGPADERWAQAYAELQAALGPRRRFELDRASNSIRFSCRNVDGNGAVFELLERLEALVERANQIAAVRRAAGPRISFAGPALGAR
ncbi:MAG TPA: hypothetical protein VGG65_01400 [Thermoanaerobaculia bacterium]|jgi:hypothetical protein